MLLSFQELIVWIGVGSFEVAIHSVGFLVFTILLAVRVEGEALTTACWHTIFTPLYVAIGLHIYFTLTLFVRMLAIVYSFSQASFKWKRLSVPLYIVTCNCIGLGAMFFVEHSIASYLDELKATQSLIISIVVFFVYLFARLILVFKTLKRENTLNF